MTYFHWLYDVGMSAYYKVDPLTNKKVGQCFL